MIDFRIVQITDMHIGGEDQFPFGVNLRSNFLNILAEVERLNPNLLVMTGDFCLKEPRADVYQWVRLQLDHLGIPFEILGGNHDDTAMMTLGLLHEDLSNEQSEYYYSDEVGDYYLLYLDSGSGQMSEEQLTWVKQEVQRAEDRELLVFMHYPPLLAGVPHMDTGYPLQNNMELIQLLNQHAGPVQVFCGHYHVHRTVVWKNIIVNITPSLYMQIFPYVEEFAIDHYQIGYRVIDFADGTLRHSVRYLPGSRF